MRRNEADSSNADGKINLPSVITVAGKGTITYTYDAAGNKLKKETVDNTVIPAKTTTTLYIGGAVYENDVLQFMGHEEGRIRYKEAAGTVPASFQYDYMLKDHLGNVRMVLTEEQKQDAYPAASMETAQAATEEALYSNVNTTRGDKPAGYPTDTYTSPNDKVAKTNGNGNKIGPAIILKVMAGDKFNLRANSWYKTYGALPGTPNPITDLGNALANSIAGISGGKIAAAELTSSGLSGNAATAFLNTQSYNGSKPKAYVNWIFLDEQFKYYGGNAEQVGGNEEFTTHLFNEVAINKNGYLYIYVSNETPNIDVFFDNLQMTHVRGAILEETHYYPFGLVQAGISSKALSFGNPKNKEKTFQGQRLDDELDLNLIQFKWRNHDPQIGRFIEIDPLSEKYEYNSTYAFSENKVTNYVELEGLEAVSATIFNHSLSHHTKNENTIILNRSQALNSSTTSYSQSNVLPKVAETIEFFTGAKGGSVNFTNSITETVSNISSNVIDLEGVGKVVASSTTVKVTEVKFDVFKKSGIESISETTTTNTSYTKVVSEDVKNNQLTISLDPKNSFAGIPKTTTQNIKVEDRQSATLSKLSAGLESKVTSAVNSNAEKLKNVSKAVDEGVRNF